MTSVKIEIRWIGLNSHHKRIVQMKNDDSATIAISVTHDLPSA